MMEPEHKMAEDPVEIKLALTSPSEELSRSLASAELRTTAAHQTFLFRSHFLMNTCVKLELTPLLQPGGFL